MSHLIRWAILYPLLLWPISLLKSLCSGSYHLLRDWLETLKPTQSLGTRGERAVARFLARQGYLLLGQNVRIAGGEIDLIVQQGHTLVFVEVKTRTVGTGYDPVAAVDRKKRRQLMKLSRWYWRKHRAELRRYRVRRYRFDVVGVDYLPATRQASGLVTALRVPHLTRRGFTLRHWQNVPME